MRNINIEPGKTAISTILLVFGIMIFLGGLQLGGPYILLGTPGLVLFVAVIDDTIGKTLRRYKKRK